MTTQSHTLVYRVEDKDGNGPYNGAGLSLYAMAKSHGRNGEFRHRTPVPEEDGLGFIYDSCDYCGFESLGALFEWFDGYAQSLHLYGFAAYVYRVEEEYVRRGFRQLLFRRNKAEKVQKIDLGCSNPARKDHLDAMHSKADREQAERRMRQAKDDLTRQAALYTKTYEPIQPRMGEEIKRLLMAKPLVPDGLIEKLVEEKGPLVSTVSEDWSTEGWTAPPSSAKSKSLAEVAESANLTAESILSFQNDTVEARKKVLDAKMDVWLGSSRLR